MEIIQETQVSTLLDRWIARLPPSSHFISADLFKIKAKKKHQGIYRFTDAAAEPAAIELPAADKLVATETAGAEPVAACSVAAWLVNRHQRQPVQK